MEGHKPPTESEPSANLAKALIACSLPASTDSAWYPDFDTTSHMTNDPEGVDTPSLYSGDERDQVTGVVLGVGRCENGLYVLQQHHHALASIILSDKTRVTRPRSKHNAIDYHFVRELIANGSLKSKQSSTDVCSSKSIESNLFPSREKSITGDLLMLMREFFWGTAAISSSSMNLHKLSCMCSAANKHEQDPAFVSEAKASVNQHAGVAGDSSQPLKKEDQVGQGNCGNGGGGCVVEVEAALAS
ncbi:hypothetical protein SADUNF_Sadunf03G0048700 [Salix dunnii]|uniref:Uncharacterized protein n=1 Tax=Salix dunnii TaxID=1413687 RepID=A0A835K735_9ROSI|nr:hypothetical protein SADUNF_Sadunf03G0048700 [Salix dunnii]